MDANKDYYEILGVSPSVEPEALKAVFRALAKKYHPDTTSSTSTSETFRDIQEAYDVLSDPELRKVYDRERFEEDEDPVADNYEDDDYDYDEETDIPQDTQEGYPDEKERTIFSLFGQLFKFILILVSSAVVASLITGIAGIWLRDSSFRVNTQSNILFGLFIGSFAVSIPIFLMGMSSIVRVCMNFLRGLIKPVAIAIGFVPLVLLALFLINMGEPLGSGLDIQDIRSKRGAEGEIDVLIVSGAIANVSDTPRDVPLIRISLFNSDGEEVQFLNLKPKHGQIPPGEKINFSGSVMDPAATARRMEVTFTLLK